MLGETVSPDRYARIVARARAQAQPWLELRADNMRESYNRKPFLLNHRLAEHPLFTLDRMFALCRRLPANQVKPRVGVVPGDTDFDASLSKYREGLTVGEAIDNFDFVGARCKKPAIRVADGRHRVFPD